MDGNVRSPRIHILELEPETKLHLPAWVRLDDLAEVWPGAATGIRQATPATIAAGAIHNERIGPVRHIEHFQQCSRPESFAELKVLRYAHVGLEEGSGLELAFLRPEQAIVEDAVAIGIEGEAGRVEWAAGRGLDHARQLKPQRHLVEAAESERMVRGVQATANVEGGVVVQ